jgi:outer membrane protein assembly factor BamB
LKPPFSGGPIFRNFARLAVAICSLALAACGGGGSVGPGPKPSIAVQALPIPNYVPPTIPSADWPQFRRDDQRTGFNPNQTLVTKANVATLAPKWIVNMPNPMFSSPVIFNGTVYQADAGGHITELNEATGQLGWTFFTGHDVGGFFGTPVYSNGVLYIGSVPGIFYAIDAATGAQKFQYPSIQNGGYESSPLVAGGVVYQGVTNLDEDIKHCLRMDQFVAFSAQSPTILNALSLTPVGSTGPGVWSSPMIDPKGFAYIATGNSCSGPSLKVADAILKVGPANMKVSWDDQGPVDNHDLDFGATPLYVGGMVVDGAKDGFVYADITTIGTIAWKTSAGIVNGSIIGSPATDGAHIFVPYINAPTGGAIVALNLDGSVAWTVLTAADENGYGVLSAPAVSQGMVFVGYKEYGCTTGPCFGISALDANTGAVLWRYKTIHSIYAGPALVDGGLFVGEFNGTSFYCFTPNGV